MLLILKRLESMRFAWTTPSVLLQVRECGHVERVCLCVRACVRVCVCVRACVHVCIDVHVCVDVHAFMCVLMCMRPCMCSDMHICIGIYMISSYRSDRQVGIL